MEESAGDEESVLIISRTLLVPVAFAIDPDIVFIEAEKFLSIFNKLDLSKY